MKRLQTQCLLGSLACHGLLLLLVVTGSGFLVAHREPDWESMPVLDFIPKNLVDAAVVGGGDPQGGAQPAPPVTRPAPRPAPPPPVVQPVQPAPVKPAPVTPPVKIAKATPAPEPVAKPVAKPPPKAAAPEPESVSETGTKKPTPKPKTIEVSKTLVTRDNTALQEARKKAAERAEAEEAEEAARWMARARQARTGQFGSAVNRLQKDLSGRSVVAVPYGPGGGGETYAGYGLYVRMVYQRAWRPPTEVPDNSAVVTARVVIGKDGHVISADIVTKSGVTTLDKSVQAALGRVSSIGRPFPEGSPDEQKTFLIDFDLQAKRGLG